jgi:methyl-accepting chemotaxis protein
VESAGAHYDPGAVSRFNKLSEQIHCSNPEIRLLAEKLYNSIQNMYQPYDLNALARRVTEKSGARRIMLRDGVYFIPLSHMHVAEKLKKFFTTLNFSFIVLPVSSESSEKQSVVRCVVRDIAQSIKSLSDEVEALKAAGNLTARVARRRLEDLEESLEQYKGLAQDLRADLKSMIDEAGESAAALYNFGVDSVDEMIAGIQSGAAARQVVPLVHDLLTAAAELDPVALPVPQPVAVEADTE